MDAEAKQQPHGNGFRPIERVLERQSEHVTLTLQLLAAVFRIARFRAFRQRNRIRLVKHRVDCRDGVFLADAVG